MYVLVMFLLCLLLLLEYIIYCCLWVMECIGGIAITLMVGIYIHLLFCGLTFIGRIFLPWQFILDFIIAFVLLTPFMFLIVIIGTVLSCLFYQFMKPWLNWGWRLSTCSIWLEGIFFKCSMLFLTNTCLNIEEYHICLVKELWACYYTCL